MGVLLLGVLLCSCVASLTQEPVQSIASIRKKLVANDEALAAARSDDRKVDAYLAWQTGGVLKIELALLDIPNRERLLAEAHDVMEELVLDTGPGSTGLFALLQLARIDEIRGNLDLAGDSYLDLIEALKEVLAERADPDRHEEPRAQDRRRLQDLLDEARLRYKAIQRGLIHRPPGI